MARVQKVCRKQQYSKNSNEALKRGKERAQPQEARCSFYEKKAQKNLVAKKKEGNPVVATPTLCVRHPHEGRCWID